LLDRWSGDGVAVHAMRALFLDAAGTPQKI